MDCLTYCANFCSLMSCVGDVRNAVAKLCPCFREKKPPEPEYHEEVVKIVFLDKTIIKFERVVELSLIHI